MAAEKNEPVEKPGELERVARLVSEGEDVLAVELPALFAGLLEATCLDSLAGPERVCAWARGQAGRGFASLWVQPCNAGRVAWELAQAGDATPVCAPLAYPQGQALSDELCFSTALMMACGAGELAVVANYGALLEESDDQAVGALAAVLSTVDADSCEEDDDACGCGCDHEHEHAHGEGCACGCDHDHDACTDDACDCDEGEAPLVKAVVEAGVLGDAGLCRAVDLLSGMGVDFVTLGTGTLCDPTPREVRLACSTVEPGVRVGVVCGAACLAEVLDLLEAGADRVATPYAAVVLDQLEELVEDVAREPLA